MDDKRLSNVPARMMRVGYWMTEKKLRRLNFCAFETLCRSAGIEMVKLNFDIPLEQQGLFDIILHKLTDQMCHSPDGNQLMVKHMDTVQRYLAAHPGVKLLDPIENVIRLCDRRQQYRYVKECDIIDESCQYFIPAFIELSTSDVAENSRLLAENGITYPVVCKPSLSHWNGHGMPLQADREEMSIIFSESGLCDVRPPCVVQTFVNHNARLFKLFVIGRRRYVVQRPSVKNLFAGDHKTIFFNSNDVSKSYSSSHLTRMDESEMDYPVMEPDKQKMDHLASALQQKFGLELFGIDVIIENGTGRYGVIDINAFPGYDGVDDFFASLLELIQCKLYGTEVPSRAATGTPQCPNSNVDTTGMTSSVEFKSSFPNAEADGIVRDLEQSVSKTKWYCFPSDLYRERMKASTLRCQSKCSLPGGQTTTEHIVSVNGFSEH